MERKLYGIMNFRLRYTPEGYTEDCKGMRREAAMWRVMRSDDFGARAGIRRISAVEPGWGCDRFLWRG